MNGMTDWLVGGVLLAVTPFVLGQQAQLVPRFPEDVLTFQQLIVWSRQQEPQPIPQPLPQRDNPVPQPDRQNQVPYHQPANDSPATQTFTGRIVKDGGRHVLKVASNTSYPLVEQGDLSRYENQPVTVVGIFDTASNTIRVAKIELLL